MDVHYSVKKRQRLRQRAFGHVWAIEREFPRGTRMTVMVYGNEQVAEGVAAYLNARTRMELPKL